MSPLEDRAWNEAVFIHRTLSSSGRTIWLHKLKHYQGEEYHDAVVAALEEIKGKADEELKLR